MLYVSECMAELPLKDALPRNLTVQNVHFFCEQMLTEFKFGVNCGLSLSRLALEKSTLKTE